MGTATYVPVTPLPWHGFTAVFIGGADRAQKLGRDAPPEGRMAEYTYRAEERILRMSLIVETPPDTPLKRGLLTAFYYGMELSRRRSEELIFQLFVEYLMDEDPWEAWEGRPSRATTDTWG